MRPLRRRLIVSRALIREMFPTFLMATGVSTFLLLVRQLFNLADLFLRRNVTALDIAKVFGLAVPHVLVLTIPIGILFAALMTSGRWSADSEFVALRSCGVRLSRVARPFVLVAGLFFVLDLGLTFVVLPRSNRALQTLTMRLALSNASAAVEPRVFNEDFPGYLLYVDKVDRTTGSWNNILLFDLSSPGEERLVIADSGDMVTNPRDGTAWLNLHDTTTHLLRPDQPRSYQESSNRELRIFLTMPAVDSAAGRRVGVRETDTAELLDRLRDPALPDTQRRQTVIELHKRAAIPAACLVLAALGFPLGIRNRRGGRGFGLTASVGIVVLYYILLNNGEILAISGKVPVAVGMWLANLVLGALAVFLLRQVTRGFEPRITLASVWEAVFRRRRRPGRAEEEAGRAPAASGGRGRARCEGDGQLPASRLATPMIGIMDRYLLRQCIAYFVLVVVAVCAIYVAVDFSEKVDDIQRNGPGVVVVASYYLLSLPRIFHDILPVAFLIAFLGTATVLERNNESTAAKAAGVSVNRLTLPLLLLGLALGVGLFIMDESVAQRANRATERLNDVIKGRKVARSYQATDRLYLFLPDGKTLVNFLQYDPETKTLIRPSIYVFDDDFELRERYMASKATYSDGTWMGEDVWSRTFRFGASPVYVRHTAPVTLPLSVGPTYFGREYRKPSQMSFLELSRYISTLRAAGYRVDALRVRLHEKIAYPLSVFVLSWLALPFAFRMGRRGTVMGIAFALVLGMAYFAVNAFISKLGEASLLSPPLAAWTPTVLFAVLALNRQTTLRT